MSVPVLPAGEVPARGAIPVTATISRISVDIDSYVGSPRVAVLKAYHGLQNHDAVAAVDVHVSSSGEGFHLVGRCDEHVGVQERLRVRRTLGDDEKRVHLDEQRAARGLPIGTMWASKGSREGERQSFSDVEAAIEYVERTSRSDLERARGLDERGHREVMDAEVPHTRCVREA